MGVEPKLTIYLLSTAVLVNYHTKLHVQDSNLWNTWTKTMGLTNLANVQKHCINRCYQFTRFYSNVNLFSATLETQ